MTLTLNEPSATADVVELADYLEFLLLQAEDQDASVTDLLRNLNLAGSAEVLNIDPYAPEGLADPDEEEAVIDPGGEILESIGASVSAEIEFRDAACGGAYPFELDDYGVLSLREHALEYPYIFMLLLSHFGGRPKSGNRLVSQIDGAKLFEDLSLIAAAEYFGWDDDHVLSYAFGFPRRITAPGFEAAINELCQLIREGEGCRKRPNLADQKDATLDLVVVRRFPDRRQGQMIGFGQCATGADWRSKLTELQPETFCKLWMLDSPAVTPMRMFFVPHAIEEAKWLHATFNAGIVFDRCRVAYHATFPWEVDLQERMTSWIADVVAAKVTT